MKILGKAYTGTCLRLSVPLDLERSLLRGLRTAHQKASALYWLQFWHESLGRASVQRETYGSSKNSESDRYWSQPHRFFIPAHRSPLENLLTQAVALLANPPQLQPGPPASFQPVVLEQSEFLPALEFLVVAVEAGRPDRLKKIDLQVKHDLPGLWILP